MGDATSPTQPTTAWIKQESQFNEKRLTFLRKSVSCSIPFSFYSSFGLFLLPFGLPRRFTSASHFGGLPRLFPCPTVRRSSTTIASEICSRSVRRSASILLISIFPAYLESGVAVTNLFQCFCIATIDRLTALAGIRSGLLCAPPRESARRRRATQCAVPARNPNPGAPAVACDKLGVVGTGNYRSLQFRAA